MRLFERLQASGRPVQIVDDPAVYQQLTGKQMPGAPPAIPRGTGLVRTDASGQKWLVLSKAQCRDLAVFQEATRLQAEHGIP